ncbi:MAG: SufD family Fe-S cluster assembly protein [candidate division SR1 bacterium]|nr:SufD family Fe-S cluster assembly protein [candidate division SR1 bacterium]
MIRNTDQALTIKTDSVIIDQFSNFSGTKKIILAKNTKTFYLIIGNTSQLDLQFTTAGEGAELHVYGLFFADAHRETKVKVDFHIQHSHTQAQLHLISFIQDERKVETDGAITIAKDIQKIQSHLLEENIILGNKISIKAKPILNISSNDVQASHGAKIEKIDAEKLLYMTSRGLTPEQAQTLVVNGYLNHITDQLISGNGGKEEKAIRTILEKIQQQVFR